MMPLRAMRWVTALLSVLIWPSGLSSAGDELLDRARQAAGGLERFRRLQTVEVRGLVSESGSAGSNGAMVFRMELPDKFVVVERRPAARTYTAGLNGGDYWAKLGDRELSSNPDGRRRVRHRSHHLQASYLLHVPSPCNVSRAAGITSVTVDSACGGFRLEFDSGAFTLQALSYDVTVYKGGSTAELKKLPGATPIDKLLNRPTSQATVRTEYSDYRVVDGWRIPFVAVTKTPARTTTFSVTSVRFNPRLTADDFKPGKSVTELQQWVDSASR